MTKTIMAWVLTLIFCPVVNAQQITVTSPAANDEWSLGSTRTITWTSSGVSGPLSIKLRLADQPTSPPLLTIVASTANDQLHSWSIPASGLAAGTYVVRVRTVSTDPIIFGDSGKFIIVAPLVLAPHSGIEFTPMLLLPDLVVCLAWHGGRPLMNEHKGITVRAKNLGPGSSPATVVALYVEGHGTRSIPVPGLAVNQELTFSYSFSWPTLGHKTVRATIDPSGQISEINENNNVIAKSIKVILPHMNRYMTSTDSCSHQN